MITIFYPDGFLIPKSDRLKQLSFKVRPFPATTVREICSQTTEHIYLIPIQAVDSDSWDKLRVELARANRLYIVVVDHPTTQDVARCMRDGAHDVLSQEDSIDRWKQAMIKAAEDQKLWIGLYGGRPLTEGQVLLGRSESIQRLRQTIDRLGPTNVCVLIQGESGVGKERVAQALHHSSKEGPFVALNCAAIPKELLEAELFGVEKGAFTGALKSRAGLVEQANGGTLFLDEIGEMELQVQPKLLRFLETHRARRVGGESEYPVHLRVISATNRNLETEIAGNRFRSDLFYRLAELILQVPPLRSRPEDIADLALSFLSSANERFGKNFEAVEPGLISRFQEYHWPGNVRELKSAIDRMALMFDGPILRAPWWERPADRRWAPAENVSMPTHPSGVMQSGNPIPLSSKQKQETAKHLLAQSDNNYTWVASQLGVNTSTLWRWRQNGKLD